MQKYLIGSLSVRFEVEEFYAANGYVAYSLAKSVGISKPKEWLKEKSAAAPGDPGTLAPLSLCGVRVAEIQKQKMR